MISLKKLALAGNDLSGDERLSDNLATLTNLEILKLSECCLEELPDGYVIYYCCRQGCQN